MTTISRMISCGRRQAGDIRLRSRFKGIMMDLYCCWMYLSIASMVSMRDGSGMRTPVQCTEQALLQWASPAGILLSDLAMSKNACVVIVGCTYWSSAPDVMGSRLYGKSDLERRGASHWVTGHLTLRDHWQIVTCAVRPFAFLEWNAVRPRTAGPSQGPSLPRAGNISLQVIAYSRPSRSNVNCPDGSIRHPCFEQQQQVIS
jgi:hypothetical protein